MITRVTTTEFETDDGVIHDIPFELDEVPTVEEFQRECPENKQLKIRRFFNIVCDY